MRTSPKRLAAAERIVADSTEYRWQTPRGLAKRLGEARTPEGSPTASVFIVLASQTFHAFTEDQVREVKR